MENKNKNESLSFIIKIAIGFIGLKNTIKDLDWWI